MKNTLTYKGYIGKVEFDGEDEVFFGAVSGINDLVSFEATSVSELKTAFEEAVDDYLETCATLGKEPDKTYKGTFNVRLTPELHQTAAAFAVREGLTLNEFVKKALSFTISQAREFQALTARPLLVNEPPAEYGIPDSKKSFPKPKSGKSKDKK